MTTLPTAQLTGRTVSTVPEITILQRLKHPHIIALHEVGRQTQCWCRTVYGGCLTPRKTLQMLSTGRVVTAGSAACLPACLGRSQMSSQVQVNHRTDQSY